jgi:hypothetical protein
LYPMFSIHGSNWARSQKNKTFEVKHLQVEVLNLKLPDKTCNIEPQNVRFLFFFDRIQ